MKNSLLILLATFLLSISTQAQQWEGKFEQLGQILPTPNHYRTGSGAPGPAYWQQRADYQIQVTLNDQNQRITGKETITYYNNSPDNLKYLWLQLDQNNLAEGNETDKTETSSIPNQLTTKQAGAQFGLNDFSGGFNIASVTDASGTPLPHTINHTMMRVDLPAPLKPGSTYSFSITWSFNIADRMKFNERSGMEYFPADGNYVYTIAQFFPRMCVYDDYEGWQNKQFLGRGEFALPFGNYSVEVTVPSDHIVAATGTLQNASDVLSATEMQRLELAKKTFDKPVFIVTEKEARAREKNKTASGTKTWRFTAENVRDFAFVSSRKFIWDAMAVDLGENKPLAMSLYPKEGNPLWERESTLAVKNTLEVYSRHTITYPYPVAISVHTASIGMEYPMICFNYGRPDANGKYTEAKRTGMIGVIVHEVGHNFFPMIINSDERQWTWMDEGLNSFVQLLTELERYPDLNWSRGIPAALVPYMRMDPAVQRPLMTNSEQVLQFGNEQYGKAATALFILRETVMGRELFDMAFKEYAERWAFKHPKPADFFRTMEDASGVDLDWFWRGWFYTTDVVDQSVENVKWFKVAEDLTSVETHVKTPAGGVNQAPFAGGPQPLNLVPSRDNEYGEFMNRIDDKSVAEKLKGKNVYEVTLANKGGLVMPVILEWTYSDGSKEIERLPAEIWRTNEQQITKTFVKTKEVVSVKLDPKQETTDIRTENNVFPRTDQPSNLERFQQRNSN